MKVGMCPNHPVERVTWNEIHQFIDKINRKNGLGGCKQNRPSRDCLRLPSEAEWEFAARRSTHTMYAFLPPYSSLDRYSWYVNNSNRQTHPVGLTIPIFGLHDMYGNVSEIVLDAYRKRLSGKPDPSRSSYWNCDYVMRGGNWMSEAKDLRSASRNKYSNCDGTTKSSRRGFRLVKVL